MKLISVSQYGNIIAEHQNILVTSGESIYTLNGKQNIKHAEQRNCIKEEEITCYS